MTTVRVGVMIGIWLEPWEREERKKEREREMDSKNTIKPSQVMSKTLLLIPDSGT